MTLLVAWIVFPVVLGLLSLGCGLIVDAAAGVKLPGTLLLPCGLALMTLVGVLCAASDLTASLALPAIAGLTIAGFGIGARRRSLRPDPWALATAVAVFVVFAAPVVLSGKATFAGYIKLDDTATWLAISDRIVDHGRSLDGLAPSSYAETLKSTIGSGYPIGSFVPLANARPFVGLDVAWVFQPYLTLLASMLALALYELAGGLIDSRRLRALVAFIAAQPALLFGYALWGGVKELGVALLVATLAALIPVVLESERVARSTVAPALVAGALIAVLSFGGLAWIGPLLVGAVVLALIRGGFKLSAGKAVGFGALALVLAAPALLSARTFFNNASKADLSGGELGNLVHPLSNLQAFGIWPVGDFRLRPEEMTATRLLVALVLAAAVWGVISAWRKRSWGLLLYAGSVSLSAVVLIAVGSPWIDGKTLATAAPAFLLAAMAGATMLVQSGRRIEGAIVIAAIAGGVLWSNVLAYHEVSLAPRDQLAELEQIAGKYRGEGPMLMTEYQPYGVRHFLRHDDAEGASELRSHVIPLVGGDSLPKGGYADIDQFNQAGLGDFPILVLRRSPVASRPPLGYQLAQKSRYYEVWQRSASAPRAAEHLPLGDAVNPVGRASCAQIKRLAARGGRGGQAGLRRAAGDDRRAAARHHLSVGLENRFGQPQRAVPEQQRQRAGAHRGAAPGTLRNLARRWRQGRDQRLRRWSQDGQRAPSAQQRRPLSRSRDGRARPGPPHGRTALQQRRAAPRQRRPRARDRPAGGRAGQHRQPRSLRVQRRRPQALRSQAGLGRSAARRLAPDAGFRNRPSKSREPPVGGSLKEGRGRHLQSLKNTAP